MDIQTNDYKVARLTDTGEALELLRQAEASISELTGCDVTLIAYEKDDKAELLNPT